MTYMDTELLVKPLNNGISHSSSEIVRLNVGGGIFEVNFFNKLYCLVHNSSWLNRLSAGEVPVQKVNIFIKLSGTEPGHQEFSTECIFICTGHFKSRVLILIGHYMLP